MVDETEGEARGCGEMGGVERRDGGVPDMFGLGIWGPEIRAVVRITWIQAYGSCARFKTGCCAMFF